MSLVKAGAKHSPPRARMQRAPKDGKAMVIKFTVSQTSGSFSSMQAGGTFLLLAHGSRAYHQLRKCTNTVFTKKGCRVAQIYTQDNIYTSALESKSMKKTCTAAFYNLAASITCSFDRLFNN